MTNTWTNSQIYAFCLAIGVAIGISLGSLVWSAGAGIAIGLAVGIVWAEWMKSSRDERRRTEQTDAASR